MGQHDPAPVPDRRAVHLDIDVAEQLVEMASLHAQGSITDSEFVELRERLLLPEAEPREDGAA